MRILLIGGNGNISWWCAKEALKRNHDVTVVTRGLTWGTRRDPHEHADYVQLDIDHLEDFGDFLEKNQFDVVSDFLNYDVKSTISRVDLLSKYKSKYVIISSTVIYKRDDSSLPFTEDSQLREIGFSPYVDGKLMIENQIKAHSVMAERTLIIRPSHTFDTNVPTPLGSNCLTEVNRVLNGGNLLIPSDGTNFWTLMHSEDFSKAWMDLIERENSYGEAFNVVNPESTTWNQIADDVLSVLGLPCSRSKHIDLSKIESIPISDESELKGSNLGSNFSIHRKWNDRYDVSKLKEQIPEWNCNRRFKDGFLETINWLSEKPERQRTNPVLLKELNQLELLANS